MMLTNYSTGPKEPEPNESKTKISPSGPEAAVVAPGVAVVVLSAINVAVFLAMALFFGAGWFDANLAPYVRFGANNGGATTDGEWWRLVTSMFLHFGVIHLLCNLWALVSAGAVVERLAGRALFLVTYFGAGLAGGLASLWWNGDRIWSAGASGAIFGLYGAILGYALRQQQAVPKAVLESLGKSALAFIGYNLIYGLMNASTDNAAHVGGLASGLLLGVMTALPLDRARLRATGGGQLGLGLAAVAAMVVAGVTFAPKYNYRFRDELAWNDFIKSFEERETKLVERQNRLTETVKQKPTTAANYAQWLEDEFAPFYRDMAERLGTLKLDPARRTAQWREGMARFARLRSEAYLHLATALRTESSDEVAKFQAKEKEAKAALGTIKG